MPHLTLSRVDWHYRIDGSGPTVLLLHGAGGSSLAWFQQAPAYSKHFQTVAIDLPGFGMSTWRSERVPFAEALEEFIEHFGWQRVGLVAHSLSGWAALRLCLSRPGLVAALVLASTWAGLRLPDVLRLLDEREQTLLRAQTRWRGRQPGSYLPGLGQRLAAEQPELHWLIAGISALNRGAAVAVWARDAQGNFDQLLMPDTEPHEVAGWSTPTLCVAGAEDIVVPPRAIELVSAALANSQFRQVDASGHSVFLERAEAFNGITLPFLRQALV
ncbi:MAG: alpha/beta hydrolase [Polyangiaceae bacterium]